jgi:hypothetical protein
MPLTKDEIKLKIQRQTRIHRILLAILCVIVALIAYVLVIEPITREINCRTNADGSPTNKEEHDACFNKYGVYFGYDLYP